MSVHVLHLKIVTQNMCTGTENKIQSRLVSKGMHPVKCVVWLACELKSVR